MHVCHFTSVHKADDTRIYHRQVKALLANEVKVTIIGRAPALIGRNENLSVVIFPEFRSRLRRFIFGSVKMLRLLKKVDADVFQFHDPELIPAGLFLRAAGKKVIFDIHEDVPKQIQMKNYIPSRLRLIIGRLYGYLEKYVSTQLDGVVASVPSIYDKFEASNRCLFRNFPDIRELPQKKAAGERNEFRLFYPGSISRARGFLSILDALLLIDERIKFVVCGNFSDSAFEQECRRHKAWSLVDYRGRVPLNEVYFIMAESDLGIQYVNDTPSYRIGYPVKVFEFLSIGVPVIISDIGNKRSLFGDFAIFCEPSNPAALAREIQLVLDDRVTVEAQALKNVVRFADNFSYRDECARYLRFLNGV